MKLTTDNRDLAELVPVLEAEVAALRAEVHRLREILARLTPDSDSLPEAPYRTAGFADCVNGNVVRKAG